MLLNKCQNVGVILIISIFEVKAGLCWYVLYCSSNGHKLQSLAALCFFRESLTVMTGEQMSAQFPRQEALSQSCCFPSCVMRHKRVPETSFENLSGRLGFVYIVAK